MSAHFSWHGRPAREVLTTGETPVPRHPNARRQAYVWLAALVLCAATARAEIEFIGVLITPGRSSFALTEDPAKPATWRALGETFAGYSLATFDAKTDTLTLTKAGAPPVRVRLKDDAKIKNARLEIAGALRIGGKEKIEVSRATLIFDEENVFPLPDGLVFRVRPMRLPDGNIRYDSAFERTGADGKVEKLSSPRLVALPHQPFGIQVGDYGFAFSPRPN